MILQRHFVFKHPLFRKTETSSGIEWRRSVYYLWWEFLRRHDGYKKTCENAGNGRCAKLYKDFGNVHAEDFKEWWTKGDRGARLFGEPAIPQSVERLTKDDLTTLERQWNDEDMLVIAVPLFLPKRFIQSRIAQMLKKYHPRKRGKRTIKESRALYPISNQFSVHSLHTALDVYDLKKSQPKLKLWEIAQQLRFTSTLNANEFGLRGQMASEAIGKKNTMGVAVKRKLNIAKSVIEGVGRGVFPTYGL
jgi:hypothetical protein